MRKMLAVLALGSVVAAAGTGCVVVAAGAAGAAGYAYIAGNAEGTVEADLARVERSALATFRELGMELQETKRDDKDTKVTLTAKGEREPVRVTIRKEGDQASRLWVRVGNTGNEEYSRTVFERIVARL